MRKVLFGNLCTLPQLRKIRKKGRDRRIRSGILRKGYTALHPVRRKIRILTCCERKYGCEYKRREPLKGRVPFFYRSFGVPFTVLRELCPIRYFQGKTSSGKTHRWYFCVYQPKSKSRIFVHFIAREDYCKLYAVKPKTFTVIGKTPFYGGK